MRSTNHSSSAGKLLRVLIIIYNNNNNNNNIRFQFLSDQTEQVEIACQASKETFKILKIKAKVDRTPLRERGRVLISLS